MGHQNAVLIFLLVATPCMSNAQEETRKVTPEIRSAIREDMSATCIAGRPATVQSEFQIKGYEEYCRCTAKVVSQDIKEKDAVEIEKQVAEYERSKKVGDVINKLLDAAILVCKNRSKQ